MVESDSSVTTLGEGSPSMPPDKSKSRSRSKDNKGSREDDSSSNGSWRSMDLLETQEEWSSGDEDEDNKSLTSPSALTGAKQPSPHQQKINSAVDDRDQEPSSKPMTDSSREPSVSGTPSTSPHVKKSNHPEKNEFLSPATRTLNALSQQSSQDLRYDMSQLESDSAAASAMLALRHSQGQGENMTTKTASKAANNQKEAKKKDGRKSRKDTASKKSRNPSGSKATKKPKTCKPNNMSGAAKKNASSSSKHTTKNRPNSPENSTKDTAPKKTILPPQEQRKKQPISEQESSSSSAPEPVTPPPRQDQEIDLTNYDIKHIMVLEEGSLGLTITKAHPPADLLPSATQQYCWVRVVKKTELGHECGIKEGDWFVADGSSQRLADYDSIVKKARDEKRPIHLYVARLKESSSRTCSRQQQKKTTSSSATDAVAGTPKALSGKKQVDDKVESEEGKATPVATGPSLSNDGKRGTKSGEAVSSKKKATPKGVTNATTDGKQSKKSSSSTDKRQKQSQSTSLNSKPSRKRVRENCKDESDEDEEDDNLPLPNNDKVVPYCLLCNNPKPKKKTKRAVHHALCPKNDCFGNSGAARIFRNVVAGVELGCPACVKTYEVGRVDTVAEHHLSTCPSRKDNPDCKEPNKKVKISSNSTESESREKKAAPTASSDQEIAGKKSRKEGGEPKATVSKPKMDKTVDEMETKKSSNYNTATEAQDNTRTAQPPQSSRKASAPKVAGQQTTGVYRGPSNGPSNSSENSEIPLKRSLKRLGESNTEVDLSSQRKRRCLSDEAPSHEAENTTQNSTHFRGELQSQPSEKPNGCSTTTGQPWSNHCSTSLQLSRSERVTKSKWVQCKNPWGPEEILESDVVLITPNRGLGHHETLFSVSRYEFEPFAESSDYRVTHNTPEDGLHVLRLERDPFAKRSWGFTVRRHEFGGACLVESVDPLSPAETAVSLHSCFA